MKIVLCQTVHYIDTVEILCYRSIMTIRNATVLTREERDILILGAMCANGRQLSNTEISQRMGIPVARVKTAIHQACVKLKAHNRNEAIVFALKHGEIRLNEFFSFNEITERLSSLGPDMLRRIADLIRWEPKYGYPPGMEQVVPADRRQDTILTDSEREVLILIGCGLTNKEIANKLFLSTSTVRTFLYRACTKLGSCRRADAVMLAVRRGEISIFDIFSTDEMIRILTPLGAEYIERVASMLDQKPEPELVSIGS